MLTFPISQKDPFDTIQKNGSRELLASRDLASFTGSIPPSFKLVYTENVSDLLTVIRLLSLVYYLDTTLHVTLTERMAGTVSRKSVCTSPDANDWLCSEIS
jgi:hypothetical protein